MLHGRLFLRLSILIPLCLLIPISVRLARHCRAVIFTLHSTLDRKYKTEVFISNHPHLLLTLRNKLVINRLL